MGGAEEGVQGGDPNLTLPGGGDPAPPFTPKGPQKLSPPTPHHPKAQGSPRGSGTPQNLGDPVPVLGFPFNSPCKSGKGPQNSRGVNWGDQGGSVYFGAAAPPQPLN